MTEFSCVLNDAFALSIICVFLYIALDILTKNTK